MILTSIQTFSISLKNSLCLQSLLLTLDTFETSEDVLEKDVTATKVGNNLDLDKISFNDIFEVHEDVLGEDNIAKLLNDQINDMNETFKENL